MDGFGREIDSVRALESTQVMVILKALFKWIWISSWIGLLAGIASTVFVKSLSWVTDWREGHLWVIALLPIAGWGLGWIADRFGKAIQGGNELILESIHHPQATIPLRMTPLVLLGALGTHLFGGSGGREGAAVQMGASLADQWSRPLRLDSDQRRILLMTGVSAGFASVFGTPLAGTIFGLEVLVIGRLKHDAIFPCLVGAIVGHQTSLALGLAHDQYAVNLDPALNQGLVFWLSILVAGVAFGLIGRFFSWSMHRLQGLSVQFFGNRPKRMLIGGLVVALGVAACGGTRYIGLGIPVIAESFVHSILPWDFAAKFLFTVVTLGSGFQGGEVTPLFFIGATFGNALAWLLPLPVPLLAALGFVAVFAGAANTPITCLILAIELFGAPVGVPAALACTVAYLVSGDHGIYRGQRSGVKAPSA